MLTKVVIDFGQPAPECSPCCCPIGGAGAGNDGGGLVGAGRDGGCETRLPLPPLGAPLLTVAGAVLLGPINKRTYIPEFH